MIQKRLVVLGGGESGVGAAVLGKKENYEVFVSDIGTITKKYKDVLLKESILFEENKHTNELIINADLVVKSPGIPETAPLIIELYEKEISVISEIEFGSRYTDAIIVGITGSNGKTTTSALTYHMLKVSGLNVGLAGNIGNSFSFLIANTDFEYIVLELSSFQLDGVLTFKPHIAIITNLSPDHLERYKDNFENYINSKFNLVLNQVNTDYLIYNSDDVKIVSELIRRKIHSIKIPFSFSKTNFNNQVYIEKNIIKSEINKNKFMIPIESLSLKGNHNVQNSMAATTVAQLLKISNEELRESLGNFQSISHRLEYVLTIQKVKYINDSKATNVNAVFYALDSMKNSTVWIAGGIDKGNNYEELLPLVREKVKAIICLGLENSKLLETFSSVTEIIVETTSMVEAVKMAYKIANPSDSVLLSPACSSFDLFKNYEDRGNQFKEAVRKL